MKNFIKAIAEKKLDTAKELFNEEIVNIVEKKLLEMKKMIMAEDTTEELEEARIAIVKARVRGGKIQRRKKVSNVAGYTLRGGQLKRMSVTERRNRRLGQRRGKIKRRAKLNRALMKRARSLRKRQALGI